MTKSDRLANAEEMTYHIECWKQSNQTQKQYCLINNIPYSRFYYWLKKERENENAIANGFVPVKTNGMRTQMITDIELHYPNGVRISVASADIRFIGQLVRLI